MRQYNSLQYRRGCLLLFSLVFTLIFSEAGFAYPENQLYWVVEEYPTDFFLYETSTTYNGAEDAIKHACSESPGSGTYSGSIRILTSSNNFPAEKAGYCQITSLGVGPFDGNLYYAYLYCNGEKREQMDDSDCLPPPPPFTPNRNLGPPPDPACP